MNNLRLAIIGFVFLSSLSPAFAASDSESILSAVLITDTSNASSVVYNLTLSEWAADTSRTYVSGGHPAIWFNYKNIIIKKGETLLTIGFDKIQRIDFDWASEKGSARVATTGVDVIVGEPISHNSVGFNSWLLRGDTDYGMFELSLNKAKSIAVQ